MCGVAGQIRFDGQAVNRADIVRMCDALAHRGPDGEGQYLDGSVGLGHRRLSIIDLDGSPQPMSSQDGHVCVTYNGEIYNFRELRQELIGYGHQFQTQGDTEVILCAWKQWGKDCVSHFRGMFAFCLIDHKQQEFLLAIDHFAIKPLLYSINDNFVVFASEMSALETLPELKLTGDYRALDWFLRLEYIPPPYSIYHEVKKLMPGHRIHGKLTGANIKVDCWWKCNFEEDKTSSDTDWLELADHTLQDSVKKHTIADVPLGTFLSGGIDSSLVTYYMHKLGVGPEPVFAVGFDDLKQSELAWANQLANKLDIEIECKTLSGGNWDHVEEAILQYGEPFGDTSLLPTRQLCEFAANRVKVCLSGDGADEAFGGYRSYTKWIALPTLKAKWKKLRKRFSTRELRSVIRALVAKDDSESSYSVQDWLEIGQNISVKDRLSLWRSEVAESIGITEIAPPMLISAHNKACKHERLAYAQHLDFQAKLPGKMLPKVDIASMAFGLEVRTPLLDIEVVSLAQRLPFETRYCSETAQGKFILKQLLQPLMGDDFVYRKKQGFGVPLRNWFYEGKGGHERLLESLNNDTLAGWFDTGHISGVLKNHSRRQNNTNLLWPIFVLDVWRRAHPNVVFS